MIHNMKKSLPILCSLFFYSAINAQSLLGAWMSSTTSENGDIIKSVVIFTEGYQVLSVYNNTSGKFIYTNGGTWTLKDDVMTEKVEFDSDNPDHVGTETSFKVAFTDNYFEIIGTDVTFTRIDDGKPGALQGAWLMSGRMRDGQPQIRDTTGPRKTMKILSGTRFQWIAYNTETKQFMGTGGGTYTTNNGDYTEQIEFFSRDDTKAGLSLKFNFNLIDGLWHHSGLSSKGDPIHELWSIRD